jgi:protein-S-isoprenylcysteine O-methyltransferase Ste14
VVALILRVRDEEKMLKEKFGKEWENWHSRTARFIPWIV